MQNKELIEISVTGILIVVLVALGVKTFGGKKGVESVNLKLVATQTTIVSQKPEDGFYGLMEKEMEKIEVKRDPFSKKVLKDSQLVLEGVLWDEEDPRVIINGQVLKKGSDIDGQIIISIQKDKVLLYDEKKDVQLRLKLSGE